MLGPRRAVHGVPGPQPPFLALHDQEALAGEDEKVLLRVLCVVHAVRLARSQDPDTDAHLVEARVLAVEQRVAIVPAAVEPAGLARVDHEPAFSGGRESLPGVLERGFRNHGP